MNALNTFTMPLIIHDLQDSQMFALAQAAGRSGIRVSGTCKPHEPWLKCSKYIDKAVEMACLGDVTSSAYALHLKNAGLAGVWLPCTDDLAEFTARYQPLLTHMGMHYISPSEDQYLMTMEYHRLPETTVIHKLFGGGMQVSELYENIQALPYPLMIKSERWNYHIIHSASDFQRYLDANNGREYLDHIMHVQAYVSGNVERMASAIILMDENSRPVRGFTGRRQRVVPSQHGAFGESTAVKAEWIPELYEGAVELLSAMGWKGFAEVECKQSEDGRWHILEVNPRLSGWTCLAEADGAGFLQAYYRMCAHGERLEEACLQRSQSDYTRVIGTCYHDPDWAVSTESNDTRWKRLQRLYKAMKQYKKNPKNTSLGAWDSHDLRASLWLMMRTIHRIWAIYRGRTKLF